MSLKKKSKGVRRSKPLADPAVTTSLEPEAPLPSPSPPTPFTAAELRRISEEINQSFPGPITQSDVTLLDVDPRHLHAYWSITPADLERAKAQLKDGAVSGELALRLYDVSPSSRREGPPSPPFDVQVQGLRGNCYVDLWQDGRSYLAELGLRDASGDFSRLARSQQVDLPKDGPAAETSSEQIAVHFPTPSLSLPPEPPVPSSDSVFTVLYSGEAEAEDGHMDEPGPPPPPPSEIDAFPEIEISSTSHALDEETQVLSAMGGDPFEGGPPPEPESPPPAADAPATPPSALPVESILTQSSFVLGREDVTLEVNAELHIFGRTKPGHRLTLYGKEVPVRPDGTFSVRRPLPHGAVVLPLLVTEEQRDEE
ncbi:hypothetical protein JCM17960_25200 [Magnetospira thiophila]